MAASMASMAMLNAKPLPTIKNNKLPAAAKPASTAPRRVLPLEAAKQGLSASSALAGAMFATFAASEPALAVQQIAEIADGDSRGTALLLPIIPALVWVLYNILQPALNQLNRMRETKGVIVGLGLGGIGAFAAAERAHAAVSEVFGAIAADAPQSDNRGQLLLIVVTPALLWVAYNILRPALNQLERMRSE
ncbi:hypothetical protein MLD38_003221 [Melastoma candidum]|uniref:Uncharacterized protein n=1 Tax=Melastoma candidum TaxID=119954 RepID=A0ACB9S239_9MYRT|nr:hypothetical protein MLD38_003221 [Melastoma candidum]